MSFRTLATELDGLVDALAAGEAPMAQVEDVLRRAHELGKDGDPAEWPLLAAAFDRLGETIGAAMSSTEGELRQVGRVRTAMSGYGSLKPETMGQRLRKQV